ncbi:MAG: response regulator transcription factor, partial [Elusimicrobia bacterium]|nr:response regulator transcription factor [Elusimicrobiota bacterium]
MIRRRVLVVEDDEEMRRFYRVFFERLYPAEFLAQVAADGDEALGVLSRQALDLALLDRRLPGLSGVDLVQAIRAHPRTRSMGVIMVSALSSPQYVVEALESGADDHLAKPFDEGVLLARLRSLTRRQSLETGASESLRWGCVVLDYRAGRLCVEGKEVHLKPKELDLLRLFMEKPGRIREPSFLWDAVWGYEHDAWQHILMVTLSSLRKKLGPKWGPRLQAH